MSSKPKFLHIRITPDLMESLRLVAKHNRRTITTEVHIAIETYVAMNTKQAPTAPQIDRGEQN